MEAENVEAQEKLVKLLDRLAKGEDVVQIYTELAEIYDAGIGGIQPDHLIIFELIHRNKLPLVCEIVDVGAGTGLCAQPFKNNGYTNIVCLEPVDALLEKAKEKPLYKECRKHFLEQGMTTEDLQNRFDAVISVGVFFTKQVTSKGIEELWLMAKNGGFIAFNFRDDHDENEHYTDKILEMEKEGKWKILDKKIYPKYPNAKKEYEWIKEGVNGHAYLLQKL